MTSQILSHTAIVTGNFPFTHTTRGLFQWLIRATRFDFLYYRHSLDENGYSTIFYYNVLSHCAFGVLLAIPSIFILILPKRHIRVMKARRFIINAWIKLIQVSYLPWMTAILLATKSTMLGLLALSGICWPTFLVIFSYSKLLPYVRSL